MGAQVFENLVTPLCQNSSTVINASATETALHPSIAIPAYYLTSGKQYRIKAWGSYSTPASSPPTVTTRLRLGTNGSGGTVGSDTAVVATPAFTTTASQVNGSFVAEGTMTCYTPSGQGLTVAEVGMLRVMWGLSTATTVTAQIGPQSAPATVAVVNTATIYLTMTAIASAATGFTLTVWMYTLEELD